MTANNQTIQCSNNEVKTTGNSPHHQTNIKWQRLRKDLIRGNIGETAVVHDDNKRDRIMA